MIISHVPAYNFEFMVHQVNVYDCKADEQTDRQTERRKDGGRYGLLYEDWRMGGQS